MWLRVVNDPHNRRAFRLVSLVSICVQMRNGKWCGENARNAIPGIMLSGTSYFAKLQVILWHYCFTLWQSLKQRYVHGSNFEFRAKKIVLILSVELLPKILTVFDFINNINDFLKVFILLYFRSSSFHSNGRFKCFNIFFNVKMLTTILLT